MFDIKETLKNNPLVLAPLAGFGASGMRVLSKRYGASIVYTEMISSMGIKFKNEKTLSMVKFEQEEIPIIFQIFGSRPDILLYAAQFLEEKGVSGVDINMGCPEPKIVKTGAGGALLQDLKLIKEIIKTVRKGLQIPLSIKIRRGFNVSDTVALEIAKIAEGEGADAIAIHPSTVIQKSTGSRDWGIIKEIKENVKISVIGNGGIKTKEDAKKIKELTNCDGIMIGRAALGNPWFFSEALMYLEGKEYKMPDLEERFLAIKEHLEREIRDKEEKNGVKEMRKHIAFYFKSLPGSTHYRNKLNNLKTKQEIIELLNDYFYYLKKRDLINTGG